MTADIAPAGSVVLCEDCHRSCWVCEGATECERYVAEMTACSQASHLRAKAARPSMLQYRGIQYDGNGEPVLVLVDCPHCLSTLAVTPAEWLASAVHAPSGPTLSIVR